MRTQLRVSLRRVWLLIAGTLMLAVPFAFAQLPGVPPVQAGMRATFYSSSASVRGTTQQAVLKPNCDPSKEDCWTDPSGRTIGLDDVPTASGQGYTNVDILYLDGQTCVMRFTAYTLDPADGRVVTAASGGEVTTGGSCSDYWINPAQLLQMPPQSTSTLRVLRGPYTVGTITVDAITIASSTSGGTNNSSYDTGTGLLVVASSRSQGGAVPTIQNNTIVAGAGGSLLTYTQVLNARLLPGIGAVEGLPSNVLNANRMVYDCSQITQAMGLGGIEIPCRLEVRLGQRTDMWMMANVLQSMPDAIGTFTTTESAHVIAATGHGGYYAAPSLLAGLQAGTVLDVDPVTGVRTTVTGVDDTAVMILEESNAERKTLVYDRRSGWLLQYVLEQHMPTGSFTTRYSLAGVE